MIPVYSLSVSKLCPRYECKPDSISFSDESVCLLFANDTFYSRSCDNESYFCNYTDISETNMGWCIYKNETHTSHLYLPGEDCYYDDDCYDGVICQDQKCKGFEKDKQCESHKQCDVGLYCNLTCQTQISLGRVGCFDDYHCSNTGGCVINSFSDATLNVCVPYFTMRNYTTNLGCSSQGQLELICESGYCMNNAGKSSCFPIPVSFSQVPIECSNDNSCYSNPLGENKVVTYQTCTCGKNKDGQSYCPLFYGDEPWVKYTQKLKKWIDSEESLNCNTIARNSYNCLKNYWGKDDLTEITYYKDFAASYHLIYNTDKCTKEIFFPYLADIIDDFDSLDLAEGLKAFILAYVLL